MRSAIPNWKKPSPGKDPIDTSVEYQISVQAGKQLHLLGNGSFLNSSSLQNIEHQ